MQSTNTDLVPASSLLSWWSAWAFPVRNAKPGAVEWGGGLALMLLCALIQHRGRVSGVKGQVWRCGGSAEASGRYGLNWSLGRREDFLCLLWSQSVMNMEHL